MKKTFIGIIFAGLLVLIVPLVSCTPAPPPTTGTAALGDTAVEPVAVVSIFGMPQKSAPGSSNIKITLKNTDIWPEKITARCSQKIRGAKL